MPKIRLDIKRLGIGDLTVAVSSVALMIGIFLPWFEFGDATTGSYSFSAADLRTWMYVPFFMSLAIIAAVVAKTVWDRPRVPLALWGALVAACGADLVLTVGCFAKKSPGLSWDSGAYLSMVAAVTAVVGAIMSRSRQGVLPGS